MQDDGDGSYAVEDGHLRPSAASAEERSPPVSENDQCIVEVPLPDPDGDGERGQEEGSTIVCADAYEETEHSKYQVKIDAYKTTMEASLASTQRKRLRCYYRHQSKLTNHFVDDIVFLRDSQKQSSAEAEPPTITRFTVMVAKLTFLLNFVLLVAKTAASVLSESYSIISLVVDSAADLTSGLIIWITSRAINKRDPYRYPRGRTRLEPLSMILISLIMIAATIQVMIASVESIIKNVAHPTFDVPVIVIMVTTIVTKILLYAVCYLHRNPSTMLMAQDHRNDVLSSFAAVICAFIGASYWPYMDPLGAVVVSCLIIFTWWRTCRKYVKMISGRIADADSISRILNVCLYSHPEFRQIETAMAYHFGSKYLVEVHVVVDQDMPLHRAHDLAEPLQRDLERLPFVERTFVHIDYNYAHRPYDEHKIV